MNLTGNTICHYWRRIGHWPRSGRSATQTWQQSYHLWQTQEPSGLRREGQSGNRWQSNSDIADPESIKAVAKKLIAEHPDLNVLVNNAGIMEPDQAAGVIDDQLLVSTVTTNLLGPIRLTSALVDQLKSRRGVIVYNTSVLAFVPLAVTAVYSATKAALHSYVLSQLFLLRDSGVRVLELAPPWVRTELMNSQEAEQAMPLDQFVSETLDALGTDADDNSCGSSKASASESRTWGACPGEGSTSKC